MGKLQVAPGDDVAKAEEISLLVDSELDAEHVEGVCVCLRDAGSMTTWVCYHMIGDHLRGTGNATCGFSLRLAAVLAAEPTVLAPSASGRARPPQPATYAWALAATLAAVTVVGWTAFSMVDTPPTAVAKAREASSVRAAQVKPPADLPADYLLAHQEYSPTMAIQGVGPYLRAVAVTTSDAQP